MSVNPREGFSAIVVNGCVTKYVSDHWNDIWDVRTFHEKTGREVAKYAYDTLDSLAASGYCAHGECHLAHIWPDGVKYTAQGDIRPMEKKERMIIFSIILRDLITIGLSNYNAQFSVV